VRRLSRVHLQPIEQVEAPERGDRDGLVTAAEDTAIVESVTLQQATARLDDACRLPATTRPPTAS